MKVSKSLPHLSLRVTLSRKLKLRLHWCWSFPSLLFVFAALLDDLDKELNNYIMRCREWYGWHFPELGKIVTDNLAYCKTVRKIGACTLVNGPGICYRYTSGFLNY